MRLLGSVRAGSRRRPVLGLMAGVTAGGCLILGPAIQSQAATAGTWTQLHPTSSPSARWQAQEAYDPATGQLVLFSGSGPGVGGDTWTFDGATWTKHVTTSTPPARDGAGLAYDPATKQLVLFKGFEPTGLTDTWTWNGSQWTQHHPADTPPGTQGCMATDEATGQLVLFGGQSDDTTFTQYGGTWTWRDGDWTQLAPTASPPAGECYMTYDAAHHDLVLVQWFTSPAQTWTYDGTTWTRQPDAPSQSGVDFSTLTYDPDLGEVVAVGGGSKSGALTPTPVWGWDGTTWSQLSGGPTPRDGASVAYDAATRQLVVFGGEPASPTSQAPVLSDTWVFTPGGTAAVTPSRIAGADRDATAVAVSKARFASPALAPVAVLARNDVFADALAGGVLAAAKQGPLLLTPSAMLDPNTQAELQRVLVPGGTVDILGGTSAISDSVTSAITALGFSVNRIFGADRFGTAIAIADALGDPSTVFEASGSDFPDALSAVPAAIAAHGAIVLTNDSTQSPATAAYLTAHATTRYAIGGPAAWADPSAIALAGADRYATSAEVAEVFFGTTTTVNLASGATFADALSGGTLAGADAQPLVLVPPTGAPTEADTAYLSTRHSTVTNLRIIGGTAAVSTSIANASAATLG